MKGLLYPMVEIPANEKKALAGTSSTPNDTNRYVTNSDPRLGVATTLQNGLLSATDKLKLNGIADSATNTPLSSSAPSDVTKATASAGTSNYAARIDHKHNIVTGTPSGLTIILTAAEGTSTSLARADHTHSVSVGTPIAVGPTNVEGTASSFCRSDHVHEGLTRGANDFALFAEKMSSGPADKILIEDSADSGIKKYIQVAHLPAASFAKQEVTQNGTLTTTSTTDVLVTGMTITPVAGVYLVFFTGSGYLSGIGAGRYIECSIYVGGVQQSGSIRDFVDQTNYYTPFNCFTIATVNGSQAIEGKWRTTYGTATMYGYRTLAVVKVG